MPVRAVVFAAGGKLLLSGSFDGTVKVWDVAEMKVQRSWQAHEGGVQCLALSPDGRTVATAERPGKDKAAEIRLWDIASGKQTAALTGPTTSVLSLAFSPKGKMLASAGGWLAEKAEVKLFDLATKKETASLPGHKEWLEAVAFSPDGRYLITGGGLNFGQPGELQVWDLTKKPKE
jgi:WD40 repeat protein